MQLEGVQLRLTKTRAKTVHLDSIASHPVTSGTIYWPALTDMRTLGRAMLGCIMFPLPGSPDPSDEVP